MTTAIFVPDCGAIIEWESFPSALYHPRNHGELTVNIADHRWCLKIYIMMNTIISIENFDAYFSYVD